ncbi:MAG: metallophosphoesterase [Clostridiales bacterium]|nr:metallophosphoesterase [Clostridiales bacterium]
MKLQFNENKEFKILAVADLQDTDKPQRESTDMLNNAVEKTAPDLIVFLGDNIAGDFPGVDKEKTRTALKAAFGSINERGIPFALVFGNHDHEGLANAENNMPEIQAKEYMLDVCRSFEYCLAERGCCKASVGNYNLPLYDSDGEKIVCNLWFMDSGTYAPGGGYGYVSEEQTEWYQQTALSLKKQNGGCPVPALLFQHIAVPEVYRLLKESKIYLPKSVKGQTAMFRHFYRKSAAVVQGGVYEAPCCADVPHRQFESWKNTGDITGAFFGHDHVNDYMGNVDGIFLTAVPAAGYYSYGMHHGVRTITICEDRPAAFESEIITSAELLKYKVKPRYKARHGFYEYSQKFKK